MTGPVGTDGYVRFEIPRSLLGMEPVSINAEGNLGSSECEIGECIVHHRHTNGFVITLKPSWQPHGWTSVIPKVHYCGIVMGRIEAIWTSVDVGEQVYTRLKIRYLCGMFWTPD